MTSNLLFSVLSWLLSPAVPRCYFAGPVVKKSEFPPPRRVRSLFFRCIYQRYQRLEIPSEAIARVQA
jgi:hypothetical protein